MIYRVVTNKLDPMHGYAPLESPRNAIDIFPHLLPEPFTYENRIDVLSNIKESAVRTALTSFLGADFGSEARNELTMHTEVLKRYTLDNPAIWFKRLMENKDYERDVRNLVKGTSFGRAYLVVGFLTATGAIWTQSQARSVSAGFQVTIPISTAAGCPTPGVTDPQISPSIANKRIYKLYKHIVEEEIFAVAYDEVKISYNIAPKPTKWGSTVVIGRPVKADASNLAFSNDSDDGIVSSGDEEDEEEIAEEEIVIVEDGTEDECQDPSRLNYFHLKLDN